MALDIYSELNTIFFQEIEIPYGMGFYLGDGLEPVFIFILFMAMTTGLKIVQVTH